LQTEHSALQSQVTSLSEQLEKLQRIVENAHGGERREQRRGANNNQRVSDFFRLTLAIFLVFGKNLTLPLHKVETRRVMMIESSVDDLCILCINICIRRDQRENDPFGI